MTTASEILSARASTHGDFSENVRIGQALRDTMTSSPGWLQCTPTQREVLSYIAGKISRILSGNPNYPDHWNDIAGYAMLALRERDGK